MRFSSRGRELFSIEQDRHGFPTNHGNHEPVPAFPRPATECFQQSRNLWIFPRCAGGKKRLWQTAGAKQAGFTCVSYIVKATAALGRSPSVTAGYGAALLALGTQRAQRGEPAMAHRRLGGPRHIVAADATKRVPPEGANTRCPYASGGRDEVYLATGGRVPPEEANARCPYASGGRDEVYLATGGCVRPGRANARRPYRRKEWGTSNPFAGSKTRGSWRALPERARNCVGSCRRAAVERAQHAWR